jgi:hypothetical protein
MPTIQNTVTMVSRVIESVQFRRRSKQVADDAEQKERRGAGEQNGERRLSMDRRRADEQGQRNGTAAETCLRLRGGVGLVRRNRDVPEADRRSADQCNQHSRHHERDGEGES